MVSGKKREKINHLEILERLIELSKKDQLGADYYDLISLIERRMKEQLLENQSLKEDLVSDSTYIATLQKELKRAKQHEGAKTSDLNQKEFEQLEKKAEESKFHAKQLERGILYLRSKLEEANTDKELLNEQLILNQEEIESLRLQLGDARKVEDQHHLLQERDEILEIYEKEIEALKQGILRAVQEVKELRGSLEEEEETKTIIEEFQQNIAKQQKEIEHLHRELEQKRKRINELETLLAETERRFSRTKAHETEKIRLEEKCHQLEKQIQEVFQQGEESAKTRAELEQKIRRFEEEKKEWEKKLQKNASEARPFQDQMNELTQKLRGQEEELKAAQIHLAKKVKDNAILQNENSELSKTIQELKSSLQAKQNIERALQERLQSASRSFEEEKKRSEEYLKKNVSRLTELESRCQDLQGIEEKYQKLQELAGHFNTVFDHEKKNREL